MKKLIVLFVVFALVGTAVFAQDAKAATIGGWGEAYFAPFFYDDVADDIGTGVGGAAGVTFKWDAEKIGLVLGYRAAFWGGGNVLWAAPEAYIWTKPLSFLTVGAGNYDGSADFGLRGKVGNFGDWADNYVMSTNNNDIIFTRFRANTGAIVALEPIEGLVIGVSFAPTNLWDGDGYDKLQIAAGYQLGNIGLIRAQFVGKTNYSGYGNFATFTPPSGYKRIEAAFALTAIEGLTLDIGAKIPLAESEGGVDYQLPYIVSVGALFGAGDFSIGGRVDTWLLGKAGSIDAPLLTLQAKVEPEFNLGAFSIGADAGVLFATDSDDTSSRFETGVGAWVKIGWGNGYLKPGLAVKGLVDGNMVFSIPVMMEYWF